MSDCMGGLRTQQQKVLTGAQLGSPSVIKPTGMLRCWLCVGTGWQSSPGGGVLNVCCSPHRGCATRAEAPSGQRRTRCAPQHCDDHWVCHVARQPSCSQRMGQDVDVSSLAHGHLLASQWHQCSLRFQ